MTGAIIAGGLGTRLRSIVTAPKCLAPVCARPFILRLLAQMAGAGVRRIVLCTGYGADQVQECVGTEFAGVPVLYSREEQPLGTAGALKLAAKTHGCDDLWLVMNGDSYLDFDVAAFRRTFHRSSCIAGIAAASVEDGRRFGALKYSGEYRVTAFEEKSNDAGSKWINAGVYLLTPQFVAEMPDSAPLSIERDVFPQCISSGLLAYPSPGRFIDIGVPESFSQAQTFFLEDVCA